MATETTGADHAADAGAAFPPFDFSTFPSQLFWLAISFVLLYILLSRLVLPKLGSIIETRKGRIASDLDEAARLKAEADEALADTEKQLAVARSDARAKAEKTRSEIDAKISEISASKASELDQKLSEAEGRIEEMKASAMSNVSEIASTTTAAILAQLGSEASSDDIEASVRKSIDEVVA